MKKAFWGGLAVLAVLLFATFAGSARADGNFDCDEAWSLCAEPESSIGYDGEYTGHDEPSLLFYSSTPGSGNSNLYQVTIPDESRVMPNQAGTGGTWNFQLHPAFWYGMALCDNQSAPEFTHEPCVPDSDSNIADGSDPTAPDYIGKHSGTAFLEVQFYPPGWAPWPPGISCDARKWCAAMAIFSLSNDYNNGIPNNSDCLGTVGIEPVNFSFITLSGTPHAPPSPLEATDDTFTPHSSSDLFMNGGDKLLLDIHDSAAGLVTVIHDLTTGQTGSMTASVANGFAQVNFEPNARAVLTERVRVPSDVRDLERAHTRSVGRALVQRGGVGRDRPLPVLLDDSGRGRGLRRSDGRRRRHHLLQPGRLAPRPGRGVHSQRTSTSTGRATCPTGRGRTRTRGRTGSTTPIRGRSRARCSTGHENYERIAFEADMPRIEAADFGGNCNRSTGENCVNPPEGAAFYPIFTTANRQSNGNPSPDAAAATTTASGTSVERT